jgi:hypothetical protein
MAASLEVIQLKVNLWKEDLVGAVNTEAEESPLLKSVTRKRLVKTEKTSYVL